MNRIPIKLEVAIRFATRITLTAIAAAAIVLAAILVAPKAVGGQSLSVLSGSMAPAVNTGDMVAVIPQDATDIKVGQIVAFNDPNGTGDLYQHRVQSVTEDNGQIIVVTKGDANNSGETWQTPIDSQVGKVVLVVPWVGTVVGRVTGGKPIQLLGRDIPVGSLAITIALFLLAGIVIAGILRGSRSDNDTDTDANPSGTQQFVDVGQQNFVQQQTEEEPTHA